MPDGLTSIGNSAFSGCSSLDILSIPDSVTSIGKYAFSGCGSLDILSIPDSVTSIGEYAFGNCRSLTSLSLSNGLTSIGNDTFRGCSALTSISIGDGLTSIGSYAFSDCYSLTSISIPDSVTSIGSGAFFDCHSLASISIPNSVTSIGSYAFKCCNGLTSISIPDSVTSIGSYALGFYSTDEKNPNLRNDKIPDFIIYGKKGSAAEDYAEKYGFPFNGPGQADISNAVVTLEKDSYTYDGKAKTPAVTVKLNGKTLILNTDYTVSYSNNTKAGTAKVTVTGKGNYKGSVTKTFTITNNSPGNNGNSDDNGSSDGNGSTGTGNSKQPITCKKKTYNVAYGTKPFKLNVTSNGSLAYQSSNSKIASVGRTNGKVTIKNTGIAYITAKTKTNSVKITIKVYPKKPAVKSLAAGRNKKLTVKWNKDKKVTGYQIQVSAAKNFKKIAKKQNAAKNSCTFKNLKAGKKYYVRLRSYKKSGKATLYSAWSKAKLSGKIKR